jgi:antitoxin VapB
LAYSVSMPETSLCQTHLLNAASGNQALRIPREFELLGDEVTVHKEGDRLIVEPMKKPSTLAELLASWEPLEEEFPDVHDGLWPLDDVKL